MPIIGHWYENQPKWRTYYDFIQPETDILKLWSDMIVVFSYECLTEYTSFYYEGDNISQNLAISLKYILIQFKEILWFLNKVVHTLALLQTARSSLNELQSVRSWNVRYKELVDDCHLDKSDCVVKVLLVCNGTDKCINYVSKRTPRKNNLTLVV